jgi:septal ring factor EnvC (AmiA/AmiB activator)
VLTLAAVLLPLLPTWAQDRAGDRATDKPADPAKKADDDKQRADELQRARVELKQMAAEIEQMKAQLDVAQANLEQAGARFKAAKARVDGLEAKGSGRTTIIEIKTPDGNVKTIEVPAGSKVIGVEQEKRFTFTRDNRDAKEWGQAQPGQPGNTEQRLADLEKKIKELTQQMDDLRKQLKQKPTSFWPATPAVPATPAAPEHELAPVKTPPPLDATPAPRKP